DARFRLLMEHVKEIQALLEFRRVSCAISLAIVVLCQLHDLARQAFHRTVARPVGGPHIERPIELGRKRLGYSPACPASRGRPVRRTKNPSFAWEAGRLLTL